MIIKTNQDEIQRYLVDAANFKGKCCSVYFPQSEEDVVAVVHEANQSKTQLTVAGNGTGLTGARVPLSGNVISMEKMNRIIEINRQKKYAVVQPGVVLNDLQSNVNDNGLLYPPDPTETDCFIGATAATNASGAKSFKYGSTRNFIETIRVILPTGDLMKLKRGENLSNGYNLNLTTESGRVIDLKIPEYKMPATKNTAGYFCKLNMDVIDLFIGSEGTLGIFTELKLRLLDLPENILSSVIFFEKELNALKFAEVVRDISSVNREKNCCSDINALGIEFFDKHALNFLRDDFPNIPSDAAAAIWFEQDVNIAEQEKIFVRLIHFINKFDGSEKDSWFAADDTERKKFKNFRHLVSSKVSDYIARMNVIKVGTDTAVPAENFLDFYFYAKNLTEAAEMNYLIYGHIGDCHMHLNMLSKNQSEYEKAKSIYSAICKKAVESGGTISAEHGIGKLKHEYLKMMYGEENIKQMARVKKTLDPNKILGLGNIFDVKYLL